MADLQQKLEAQNAMEPEYLEETTKAQLLDEISDILRWGVRHRSLSPIPVLLIHFPAFLHGF